MDSPSLAASYLWKVAVTGLAAADTAVEAVGAEDDAGSRTSWSVADVCSAMPKLRHQEGKHELGKEDKSSLNVIEPSKADARQSLRRLLAMHGVTPHLSARTNAGQAALEDEMVRGARESATFNNVRPLRAQPWKLSQGKRRLPKHLD
ncbi:hypothetical protein TARUN_1919 [Trichoderma arundinaceum]|uniref:Uncharacterized protein n=1 Tax=Trichoderma arundinaceum TaxID=490622 RepID=A0A395NW27_TRIAR|nr:hypothetical protein TARUN_1919 [Trichoderma arundinaceum]